MKQISIIVPCFNEGATLLTFFDKISVYAKKRKEEEFEIVFVDDGSQDDTADKIKEIKRQGKLGLKIKYVIFDKNYGKEMAMGVGLRKATGDAAMVIDADLPFEVDELDRFIDSWKKGNQIISWNRIEKRKSLLRKMFSVLFNLIFTLLSGTRFKKDENDFQMIDRKVLKKINSYPLRGRFYRFLLSGMNFKRDSVEFEIGQGLREESSFTLKSLIKYTFTTILNQSKRIYYLPLIVFATLGFAAFLFTLAYYYFSVAEQTYILTYIAIAFLIFLNELVRRGLQIYKTQSMYEFTASEPVYISKEEG